MTVDLLLDTHMLLWFVRGDDRASWLRQIVESLDSTITCSSISYAEMAIKSSVGKLDDVASAVRETALDMGFLEMSFTPGHAEMLARLPMHHRDPFDRMLIAQALSEDYVIATADSKFQSYDGVRLCDGSELT